MELHTIGIDLGKTIFHLVGLNLRGEVVVRKKFSRKQLLHFTANLQVKKKRAISERAVSYPKTTRPGSRSAKYALPAGRRVLCETRTRLADVAGL
jgi:hypothetical protein